MVSLHSFTSLIVFLFGVNADYGVLEWKTTIYNPTYHVPSDHIPLIIHYPNATDKTLTFPIIVFNHGGDCDNTWYDYIWENLVPQGYIVAMPGLYEHPWIWEYEYSAAQRYTLDWLRSEANTNKSSPLYGIVGNKSIASGHSMGGGATFLSISNFNHKNETFMYQFDGAFTLSGCDNRYDELINSLPNIPSNKTVFIMSGSKDCICPPDHNSDVFYKDVPNDVCKFLANIQNGTHCHFEEASDFGMDECIAAEEVVFCPFHDHRDNLPAKEQYQFVNEYFTLFVNATMQSSGIDENTIQIIKNKLQNDQTNGKMSNVASNCT